MPKNVYGILADCPFSSPKHIIKKVLKDKNLPSWFFYPLIYVSARLFGGFNLNKETAENAVKNSKIPTIVMHGEADKFVPLNMSKPIKKARSDIEYYTFPDAGHVLCYIVDTERYETLVKNFIDKYCPKK